MVSRAKENVTLTPNGVGGLHATIQSGFKNVVVVHRNPDGSLTQSCVDNLDAVTRALEPAAPRGGELQ
jgi:hypothetical protein